MQYQFFELLNKGYSYEDAKRYYDQQSQMLNDQIDKYNDYQQQQLNQAGNVIWGTNMAILMLSNAINLGSFIKGGYRNAKDILGNTVIKIGEKQGAVKDFTTKEIAKAIANNTIKMEAKEIPNRTAKIAGRWVLNMADEGIQEGSQSEISTTAQIVTTSRMNKYAIDKGLTNAMMNPESTDEFITYAKAAVEAYNQQFGSISSPGWEEVFIGALTGGLALPGVHYKYDVNDAGQLKKKFSVQWNGGLAEAIKDIDGDEGSANV